MVATLASATFRETSVKQSVPDPLIIGKKEVNAIYSPRGKSRAEHRPMVGAVMIHRPATTQQRNNQQRVKRL